PRRVARMTPPARTRLQEIGVDERLRGTALGEQDAHLGAIEKHRRVGPPNGPDGSVEKRAGLDGRAAIDEQLREDRRRPGLLRRYTPVRSRRKARSQLGLCLGELTA